VVEFEDSQATVDGDGLSFAPEREGGTGEGTIYVKAHVFVGAAEEGAYYPGVLAFDGSDGAEIGWTGGETKKSATSCTINFAGPTYSSIAAGKDGIVFVFDPGKESPFAAPRVVEFGPGGKGCPAAQASEPVAMVNGKPLSASETITAGTPIAFSSTLTQANALSVEWDFGDGQTQTDSADEYRHTEVKLAHGLVRGGELTVTETIHTDDLATPTIVEQTKISVSATAPPPTAVLEGPSEVTLGGGGTLGRLEYLEGGGLGLEEAAQSEEATFDASASFASTATGPNSIKTYHWVFGDGESDTTATATVKHKYKKAGVYRVELTVTDALGLTSEPSTLAVKVNEPSPERPGSSGNILGAPGTGTVVVVTTTSAHASSTGTGAGAAHNTHAVPDAGLASTSLAVGSTGVVDLNVTCPAGESLCVGTIALRSLGAAGASASSSSPSKGAKQRGAKALTLAAGRFTVAGGHTVSVKLRLSVRARILLARANVLRATVTIVAHDPSGASHTTQRLVTLHAPKSPGRRPKG
jgi:PKD repeat protein